MPINKKAQNSKLTDLLSLTAMVLVMIPVLLPASSWAATEDAGQESEAPATPQVPVKHRHHHPRKIVKPAKFQSHDSTSTSTSTSADKSTAPSIAPVPAQPHKLHTRVSANTDNGSGSAQPSVLPAPPRVPEKLRTKVSASTSTPVDTYIPAVDPAPAPQQPHKLHSHVSANTDNGNNSAPPAVLPAPPQVPEKLKSKVSANNDNGNNSAQPVAPPAAPAVPPKLQSHVGAASLAPATGAIDSAGDGKSDATPPPPNAPVKLHSHVAASQTTGPQPAAPQVDPQAPVSTGASTNAPVAALPAPPAAAPKMQVRTPPAAPSDASSVDAASTAGATQPAPAPNAPVKFHSRIAGATAETPAPAVATPDASLTEQIKAAPPAATTCTPSMATDGLSQAEELKRTLNQTLAQKPAVKGSENDPLKWDSDDPIDSQTLVKIGAKDKPPKAAPDLSQENGVGSAVKKLLPSAHTEVKRMVRYRHDRNGRPVKVGPYEGSKGLCLQGVRMAFQASFPGIKAPWPTNAKDAGPALKKYGWTLAPAGQYTSSNAPVGAVLIYRNPTNPKHAGHIEIKGTDGYYSDFYEISPIDKKHISRRLAEVWVPPQS